MASFLIPAAPGSDKAVTVTCSGDGAELLQLPKLQFNFQKSNPEVFMRGRRLAGKLRSNRSRWFRVVLDMQRDTGSRVMPRFTLSAGSKPSTLKVLTKHWTHCGVPWVRILQDGGDSDRLPDCTWNDNLYAA